MNIEFDPAKDSANIAKHGMSLADAWRFEMAAAVITADNRADYGEARSRAFGRIEGEGFCLVFALRGETIRVISFRRAHNKEMRRYGL